jgi:cell wall-associated NlpC family hydrolase
MSVLDADARRRIVATARQLLGVPYDRLHSDDSWKNLRARPSALDCSQLVCRVACAALGYEVGTLATDAGWLLDKLAHVDGTTAPGDVVGYCRKATEAERVTAGPLVWHVMIFIGNNTVLGACDLAGVVVERSIVYERRWGAQRWLRIAKPVIPPQPFRRMELATVCGATGGVPPT